MPGTPVVCMVTGAGLGMPMAGTPAAFMPGASMAQAWSIIIMAAAAGTVAALDSYAVGSVVATVPPGCPYQFVEGTNYYVCDGTWFQPYYGIKPLH